MISVIYARNFKGFEGFDQPLGLYNLFIGENGSGKTARIQALTLAVAGYLPTDQKKQAGVIYATHGDGKKEMVVAFKSDSGGRFARKYLPGESGVSCSCSLNGKAITQKQIEITLRDLGNPRIFDLHDFNELSEPKKIDYLLRLSPPGPELGKIDLDLSEAEEKANKMAADIRGKKMTIEQLTEAKSGIVLPSGTLAEIQKDISTKEAELAQAEDDLKAEELAEQKRKDEEEKAKEIEKAMGIAKEIGKAEGRQEIQEDLGDLFKRTEKAEGELKQVREEAGKNEKAFQDTMTAAAGNLRPDYREMCLESMKKIRDTMVQAGCGACAALLVLKMEAGKFKVKGE
jgi:DNA repair exonuclease SbcCD ATPase subunit